MVNPAPQTDNRIILSYIIQHATVLSYDLGELIDWIKRMHIESYWARQS